MINPSRLAAIALTAAALASFACAPVVKPEETPAPTAELTSFPTNTPTEATTQEPTADPTAEPTAVPSEAPAFPTPPKLGNLVNGGAVLPDGCEYFVLDGESDLHYVYDKYGEPVTVFCAPDDDFNHWTNVAGIYGEYGIPYGYSIKRGELLSDHTIIFADRLFEYVYPMFDYPEDSEYANYYGSFFTAMWDEKLENRIEFDAEHIRKIGVCGSILPVDGKIVVLEAGPSHDDPETGLTVDVYSAAILDENGELIGELDTEPFGGVRNIYGVFGKNYLLVNMDDERHPMERSGEWKDLWRFDIYSLSGECVMSDCWTNMTGAFYTESDMGVSCWSVKYVVNRQGEVFDGDLDLIRSFDPDTDLNEVEVFPLDIYYSIFGISPYAGDYTVEQNGVYAGVKDENGNWVFRIYDPKGASDSQPETDWDE